MESTRNKAMGNQRPVDADCIKYTLMKEICPNNGTTFRPT